MVNHDDLNGLQGGSANQYFHLTSAQLTNLNNQSGVNTNDETVTSIKTKLGISTLSGSNTGDETHNTIITKIGFNPASENYALVMAVAMGG